MSAVSPKDRQEARLILELVPDEDLPTLRRMLAGLSQAQSDSVSAALLTAPLDDEDVTADDLAGYRVYRSRYRGARPEIVSDGIVGLTRFTDTGAKPGAVYAVSAVDTSLNEGPRSGAVTFEEAAP